MESAFRHCEEIVRESGKDRYLATLFAPAERRGPLFALDAFGLEIAGVRDRAREPMPGEIRLQWWRDVLCGERTSEASAHPVASALLETITRFALPKEPLLDLIEAHSFDLYDDPMPDMAALEGYARKTGGVLFGAAARVLAGNAGALDEAAAHAGLADTIASLLRSFARHASRQQIYVPLDVLDRHGVSVNSIYAGQVTPALSAALADLRAEARRHVTAFEGLVPQLPAAAMPAFLPVALVPSYLNVMERPGYDPLHTPVEIAQWRRQWTLWRAARRYAGLMRG